MEHSDNRRLKDISLDQIEWARIDEILHVLEPFFKYTIQLQSEHCTLSDFFGFWKSIQLKLEKITHPLSLALLNEMARRHTCLLENPALLGAVYLDPRFQRTLTPQLQQTAIEFLSTVHKRNETVENELKDRESTPQDVQENVDNVDDYDNELAVYLESLDQAEIVPIQDSRTSESDIASILKNFANQKEPIKTSVLQFWQDKKNFHSEIYKIASAVFAISPTQSSVERAFSAVTIVMTPTRTRLNDITLQNILLVKLNRSLFEAIEFQV